MNRTKQKERRAGASLAHLEGGRGIGYRAGGEGEGGDRIE